MLKRIGVKSRIVRTPQELSSEKIILPGVGSFDTGMEHLVKNDWIEVLNHKVKKERIPTLGICLGMQLMTRRSDEGDLDGLGWIEGEVLKFSNNLLRIPHMGWNVVNVTDKDQPSILESTDEELRFYFVHSYYVKLEHGGDQLASCNYGIEFTSAFKHENIFGVQFHPEKSHKFGSRLLNNFSML